MRGRLPRLLVHLCVAVSGVYALLDPPPSIVAAADPALAVTWSVCLLLGGLLSGWAVWTGWVLPHVAGLGLEVLGVIVYCVALWLVAESMAVSAILLLAAFAIGLLDAGLRIRRNALRGHRE